LGVRRRIKTNGRQLGMKGIDPKLREGEGRGRERERERERDHKFYQSLVILSNCILLFISCFSL
jgi:hypothetical protein